MQLLRPEANAFDRFHSHPNKPLRVHTQGVIDKTRARSVSPVAAVAALFHDAGKLNPNFQAKLRGEKPQGYSKHALLSAHVFLCFCARNKPSQLGFTSKAHNYATLAIISRHHGHLPNFHDLFSLSECEALRDFLSRKPSIEASQFLMQWLQHESFDIHDMSPMLLVSNFNRLEQIAKPLDAFFETQWAFAALIESDKRDAGDNNSSRRREELDAARPHFSARLNFYFDALQPNSDLNRARTRMRESALETLRAGLAQGERTFSLTAPTGAGKTLMLLALADAIRQHETGKPEKSEATQGDSDLGDSDFGVVYALPFLSITEQVESVCTRVFGDALPIARADSRAQNERLNELLEQIEDDPQMQDELLREHFAAETFDHAFIVTTFVQLCETLLSNRNATLLKLPNFRRTIFLLDEIQALPPRLYSFFAAHLQEFCARFHCYAIFSTATMPALDFAAKTLEPKRDPRKLFALHQTPRELLGKAFFENKVFDRYRICRLPQAKIEMDELAQTIAREEESCLVVLNTIADTRQLFQALHEYSCGAQTLLLNTHFTPRDRRLKLYLAKRRLRAGKRVILVSTQLIEAGVDIDFPVVFRDLCPLPNLVQCAGRCNRHGKRARGTVWFFELLGESGKSRADLIYGRREPVWFLNFSRHEIAASVGDDGITERELLAIQTRYFEMTRDNLSAGDHGDINIIEKINTLAFKDLGAFRLIDEAQFGQERRFYMPRNMDDNEWEKLEELANATPRRGGFKETRSHKIAIEKQLRAMGERVVTLRVGKGSTPPPAINREPLLGLFCLAKPDSDYSFEEGLRPDNQATAFL